MTTSSTGIAAIVGVAESDLGETGRTALELSVQAVVRALDDAGLALRDVDAILTTNLGLFPATQIAEYFGIRPRFADSTSAGGSSFVSFVARAAEAIRRGQASVALITYGSNQRTVRSRRLGGISDTSLPEGQFELPFAPLKPISLYAMAAHRHMHEFGTTEAHLAEVAIAAREWALLNPKAFRHDAGPLTVSDVINSPMISSPLHVADCCLITDGGGAVIVTSVEHARNLRNSPVLVLGHGESNTNVSLSQIPDLTVTGAAASAQAAYSMAGLGPQDVDVAQLYDSFTITVLLTLEALGFCKRGEAGEFLSDRRGRPGGGFALNTSGGGLSYCHPGMFGIFLVIEAVRQLRGDCGVRQVPDAEIALAHGTGGILSTHATLLLGVDRR